MFVCGYEEKVCVKDESIETSMKRFLLQEEPLKVWQMCEWGL